jgi:nitrogen fixation protein NifQ
VFLTAAPHAPALRLLREETCARLQARAAALPNTGRLARMLASHVTGQGGLPPGLGLSLPAFTTLLARHFPGVPGVERARAADPPADLPDRTGEDEGADLLALLLEHRAGADRSEGWMAVIVAAGCMGGNHLWEDLGLWSRADLNRLMRENFPGLAGLNAGDMKWKKFLYRQICLREGLNVCPAPSCHACVDYRGCFGPEE